MLFTDDGGSVVYPCHSLLVVLEVSSRRQRFFIGHTDKARREATATIIRGY